MFSVHQIIVPALLAFIGTSWIFPKVLKISVMKGLVDNPNARKLQRRPIPNMGGIAVFFGMIIGFCSSHTILGCPSVFMLMAAMLVMLYVGTMDDIMGLTPKMRFLIEILVVCWLMYVNRASIDCFWGLWGVWGVPGWLSWPLTVFACVGIINAINLIDGVNGLSSGFCFMASVFFAIMFYLSGNLVMMIIAVSAAGAIVPFFLHNVFGYNTRMFIGDGGTLVIGTMMSMFVISVLKQDSYSARFVFDGMGLVPFTLAVLSIPVFDTLRVMSSRILRGVSPFSPDKTHLHHMFIDLGFSHIGTTIAILSLDFLIILMWFFSYKLGASVDMQLYIVLFLSLLFTFGLYNYSAMQIKTEGKGLKHLKSVAKFINLEKKGMWVVLQNFIDKF